ncbi:MAG: ATP-dependent Clp protease adaptor ClpS [Bacteroidetes bacterium]|nr:ATP-dependent Clp protease adaptor ClpS [Bacteroidota bacterium]
MTKEQTDPVNNLDSQQENILDLILYNDDVNTFEFVIKTLIEVCKHNSEQAEQCAMIAHMKGRCPVKNGVADILIPMKSEMTTRGLIVTIE